MIADLLAKLGVPFEESIVPPNGKNVPGTLLASWDSITVHETANTDVGADARMHNRFIRNGGGIEQVSFTFVVDSTRIIQNLPLNQVNYAQGTTTGNHTSISIETCVNADGDFDVTCHNLAKLLAALGPKPIVQHFTWYGKDCPHQIRATPGKWPWLMALVKEYAAMLRENSVVNGFTIAGGFLDLWNKYGIEVMGLPLSAEYTETVDLPGIGPTAVTFQDWENVVTEWRPGIAARIGAGIRKYKYNK